MNITNIPTRHFAIKPSNQASPHPLLVGPAITSITQTSQHYSPPSFGENWLSRLKAAYIKKKKRNNQIAIGTASTGVILAGLYGSNDPILTGIAVIIGLTIAHIGPIYFTHKGLYQKGLRHGEEAILDDAKQPEGMATRTIQMALTGIMGRDITIDKLKPDLYKLSLKHPTQSNTLPSPKFFDKLEATLNSSLKESPGLVAVISAFSIIPDYENQSIQLAIHRPEGYELKPEDNIPARRSFKSFMFKWYPGLAKAFWRNPIQR